MHVERAAAGCDEDRIAVLKEVAVWYICRRDMMGKASTGMTDGARGCERQEKERLMGKGRDGSAIDDDRNNIPSSPE